jgi:hypothetical protein
MLKRMFLARDCLRLLILLENESALRVWHLDRLEKRLRELGLGKGVEFFSKTPSK